MAQRQKEEVRAALVAAAAEELCAVGFERATLSAIAERAGTSIGNLYKYFASKDELFAETVPESMVLELRRLLERRVDALGAARDVSAIPHDHPYRSASDDLHRFAFAHRAAVLFVLRRAAGTRYASFAEDLANELARMAARYAKRAYPDLSVGAAKRAALVRIYRGFVSAVASILAEESSDRAFRDVTEHFTTYHLAGLKALLSR